MNDKPHKNQAFTLLEILLVFAAIAILATIVIVAINPQRQLQQFRDTQRLSHLNQLNSALMQYIIEGNSLPTEITTIPEEICNTGSTPGDEVPQPDCGGLINLSFLVPTYISQIPKDPQQSTSAFLPTTYAQALSTSGYTVARGEVNNPIVQAPKSETRPVGLGKLHNPYSLKFDGEEGSVLTTPDGNLNLMSTYGGEYGTGTFMAWVYNSEENASASSGTGFANNLFFRYFDVRHSDRKLRLMIRNVEDNVNYWPVSNGQVPLGVWMHVVFMLKGAEGYEFYINGDLDKITTDSRLGMINYADVAIGRSWTSGTEWIGRLSDVRVYNRALSEQEIQNLYNGIHISNGLVGWWNFNEGEGTTTEDLSGNNNHGTLNGGVTWSEDTP